MIYKVGSKLYLVNADGFGMNGEVVHKFIVNGVDYYLIRYETGLTVPYSHKELDTLVVYDW